MWESSANGPLSMFGKMFIFIGLLLILLGLFFLIGDRLPFRLGRLPGDIIVKRDNFVFFFPIVTSLLLSLVLTLIFSLLARK